MIRSEDFRKSEKFCALVVIAHDFKKKKKTLTTLLKVGLEKTNKQTNKN